MLGWLLAATGVLAAAAPGAATAYEMLVFPRVEALRTSAYAGLPSETEWIAAASIFYASDWRQLRSLVEFSLEYTHEPDEIEREKEFERAQIGWRFDPNDTLWFGRYHTPLGYWNTAHHHGAHLQTTISRPRILDFEDNGGILPVHFFGLFLQGLQSSNAGGAVSYDLGVASGPTFANGQLEPVKVLAPQHYGKASFVGRMSWRPDAVAETEAGVFGARSRIPVAALPADEITQLVAGTFANLDFSPWHLLGEFFWVRNTFRSTGAAQRFLAASIEADYRLSSMWVVFARHEALGATANDAYLALFPDFPKARTLAGVRFDITHHQAVTFEVASHERRDGLRYLQTALQWSTVVP